MKQTAQEPLSSPEAANLLGNRAALKALLASPETKRLMHLLSQQNGAQLQTAAERAKAGDTAALSEMLQSLGKTGDGSAALRELEEKLNRK